MTVRANLDRLIARLREMLERAKARHPVPAVPAGAPPLPWRGGLPPWALEGVLPGRGTGVEDENNIDLELVDGILVPLSKREG